MQFAPQDTVLCKPPFEQSRTVALPELAWMVPRIAQTDKVA